MADDIMPEEAARRRRLGELRRMAMRYPVVPESVDAAIERQRAAARDVVARENPARVPLDTPAQTHLFFVILRVEIFPWRLALPLLRGVGRFVTTPLVHLRKKRLS